VAFQGSVSIQATTFVEILQMRAAETPADLAYCFLVNGEEEGPRLTYADLDQAARSIAVALREGTEPGDRALLVYEPGLDFIPALFGCLYAGVIPVPVCPPRLDRLAQSWQVLTNVTADCRPRFVLTTGDLAGSLAKGLSSAGPLSCLATEQVERSQAHRYREPTIRPETIALLQYTSGSTSAPKGVMVSHANLLHNERIIETALEHSGPGLGVCWMPLYHDFALIGGVLQGVFHGQSPVVLMSPLAMLQRPLRWLAAISHYRSDTTGAPNFAYDLCAQRITAAEKASLDLSQWSIASIGSEPINPGTMERFSAAFASCGFRPEAFYPSYGLAEATLFVAGATKGALPVVRTVSAAALEHGTVVDVPREAPGARALVGCGMPRLEQRLAIVHPESLTRVPPGTVGEIWVAGPSVAQGYWNRPEETERTFRARLHGSGEGPFLRTGDLGFMQDDQLFITGRLKEIIIIRGRNHYPQDIEATVQSVHPALRPACGAAFEIDREGQARLVAVQEIDRRSRDVDLARLAGDIREAVAERHDLQLYDVQFLEPGSLPKTSSGKVQRYACRAGYESGTLRRWRER
jgi:acyl-CoA synthetase (AMP-forming)/AMP-acid ligase II